MGKVVITPSLFHFDQPTARNKVWSCICSRAWGCGGDSVDSRCHRMGWVGYSSVCGAARAVSTYRLTYDPRCPSHPHRIWHEMFPLMYSLPYLTRADGVKPKSIDTLATKVPTPTSPYTLCSLYLPLPATAQRRHLPPFVITSHLDSSSRPSRSSLRR